MAGSPVIAPPMDNITCPSYTVEEFRRHTAGIGPQMLRVNGLTLANAILAGILVGIGNYGARYRHRAFVRALFQGANTLFLPILSYVASNASTTESHTFSESDTLRISTSCSASAHLFLVLVWAGLVHIVGFNTCTIVAASKREDRISGLPMVLLVQAIWSTYLMVSLVPESYYTFDEPLLTLLPITFALLFTKIAFKHYEFQKARRSFAFGRNPPLIVGYIKQLQDGSKYGGHSPPPLIVMGEDTEEVEKGAHGFLFKRMCHNQAGASMTTGSSGTSLVTMDKVWQFNDHTGLISSTTCWQLKDVCLSFTLFKLLRCRFAGYTVAQAGLQQVRDFFLHVLLKHKDHERVHGVITDELSFLHDYYYSSIPIHYSNFWLPIVNICISLLTISDCLLLAGIHMYLFISDQYTSNPEAGYTKDRSQVYCYQYCDNKNGDGSAGLVAYSAIYPARFGHIAYDMVPVAILLAVVVLAEAREIASYICSNWTKVALFSYCVVNNHDAWQRSPRMQKWIARVLRRPPNKLMSHWDDKMYQCSVLVMHPRRIDPVISLVMSLLRLPDTRKNVKVPGELKGRIVTALTSTLTSNDRHLTDPKTFLRRILEDDGIGSSNDDFLWACESGGISDLLLTWHIATSILEMRQGQVQQHPHDVSEDMTVATHLSRYCAYLVAYVPELLPDDDEWCKSLYKAVKDCTRVLDAWAASAPTPADATTRYRKLLSLLQEPEPKHHVVLMNGVKLGEQLVNKLLQHREATDHQKNQGEAAVARILAGFWSHMILYIAPSDNLKGHAEATARGGELITLVWALLMNVGIASRPNCADASTATVDGV